jgi:hypothetical protein
MVVSVFVAAAVVVFVQAVVFEAAFLPLQVHMHLQLQLLMLLPKAS